MSQGSPPLPGLDAATARLLRFAAGDAAPEQAFDGADVSPATLASLPGEEIRWNKAHHALSLRGAQLAGAHLRSANLSFADLGAADLSGAQGAGLCLEGACLEGAQLNGVDLIGANLARIEGGEAIFTEGLLEDAVFTEAKLRFADFSDATLEGANCAGADLWGAKLRRIAGGRMMLNSARLDESSLEEADLTSADLQGATLRRVNLSRAMLRNANLTSATLDGADLSGANLAGAVLPNVSLASCNLKQARFAGAWLERTRMRARQLTEGVGEEVSGDLEAAIDSYIVLERNFQSLGISEDARWAYLRKRRVGRRLHAQRCRAALGKKHWEVGARAGLYWLGDTLAEWLCDYGESLLRVARAFVAIMVAFALVYWLTHSLQPRPGMLHARLWAPVNYLLFSLDSMTTVGTSEVSLSPRNELGILLSSLQTVIGTVLLGLFGFVLGARIRN